MYTRISCHHNVYPTLRRSRENDDDNVKGLASAPKTLIDGDALPDIAALDLTFRPEMGVHAALSLPANLPLDFIAGTFIPPKTSYSLSYRYPVCNDQSLTIIR